MFSSSKRSGSGGGGGGGDISLPSDLHYCTIVTPAGSEFKSPSGMVGAAKKVVVDIKTSKSKLTKVGKTIFFFISPLFN